MVLLIDGIRYKLRKPSNEDELEKEVKEHIEELFGKDCFSFEKQRMKSLSGLGTIPDVFVLSLPNKWYIVEVELSTHPIYDHIVSQVTKFMHAYGNPHTKEKLRDSFYGEITGNRVIKAKVEEAISGEIHKFLSDLISKPPTLVIIIEQRTQELEEACKSLSWQPKVVEFKTFVREDAPQVHAHLFEPVEVVKPSPETIKPPSVKPISDVMPPPTGRRVEVEDLIEAVLIRPGERIFREYKGRRYEAEIMPNGNIRLLRDSSEWGSLSKAASYATSTSIDGWIWWYIERRGKPILIDELRKEYLKL